MPGKGIILVHSEEDVELVDSVLEHISVLDTITKLETKDVESLDRLGTVALKKKLKGREAIVMILSAPVLSSKFLRQPIVQEFAEADNLLLLSGRPCAWRIVPWLQDRSVWPESGCISDVTGIQLDNDMTQLAYSLASKLGERFEFEPSPVIEVEDKKIPVASSPELLAADESEADDEAEETIEQIIDEDVIEEGLSDDNEETEDSVLEAAWEDVASPEIAAGPATDEIPQSNSTEIASGIDASGDYSDLAAQFDNTCASVLPRNAQLNDEILAALLELGLILGSTQEDEGDIAGAQHLYLHAARKLIDMINGGLVDGHPISKFVRSVRLAMWRSLKEAESGNIDVDVLRRAFEETLDAIAMA